MSTLRIEFSEDTTGVRNNLLAIDLGYIYLRTTAFLCISKAKTWCSLWLIFLSSKQLLRSHQP